MRILLLRFSALGDVILTLPLIKKLQKTYPQAEITLVSRPYLKSLANALNIDFFSADIDHKYKGFKGLLKLSRHLQKQYQPTHVIDLHNVLRTKVIRRYFRLTHAKTSYLLKDRASQKSLVQYPSKDFRPLPHITERYRQTIENTGLKLQFNPKTDHLLMPEVDLPEPILSELVPGKNHLGLAPFSQHQSKQYPLNKLVEAFNALPQDEHIIWLFGGKNEQPQLKNLAEKLHAKTIIVAGTLKLPQEIKLMSMLHAVLAMDSSNMHMAAVSGTKAISIWGATHPFAGYAPLGINEQYILQVPATELQCRPCSIYGKKPCFRGDHACMERLSADKVKEKLQA